MERVVRTDIPHYARVLRIRGRRVLMIFGEEAKEVRLARRRGYRVRVRRIYDCH